MRTVKAIRFAKTGYIAMSIALLLLGTLVLIFPGITLRAFNIILGIVVIVFGGIKIVGYFSKDLYRLAFQHDMAAGILLIALGIFALVQPNAAINIFCIAFGIIILADGLLKIQISMDARQFGVEKWWLVLVLAILSAVAGCLLIFRPSDASRAIMILSGIALLIEGGMNLGVALCTVKIIGNLHPDVVEAEGWNVS